MWEIRVNHDGLLASRVLRGHTHADVQSKADLQISLWDERWAALQQTGAARAATLTRQRLARHGKTLAGRLTGEAALRMAALNSLLEASLATGPFFHWDLLKSRAALPALPIVTPVLRRSPPPPLEERHQPRLDLLDKLIPSRRKNKLASAVQLYAHTLAAWHTACRETEASNQRNAKEAQLGTRRQTARRKEHLAAQLAQHKSVEASKLDFLRRDPDAVEYFFSEVLSRSAYPLGFPADATLQYVPSTCHLLVDYELPSLAAWPTCREVRYHPSRRALQELPVTDLWTRRSYDDALYQVCLRVLSELFAHDDTRALDLIGFNGWVRCLDKATGNIAHHCVMSIRVKRDAFMTINLANVDPKACFKNLNGLASSKLFEPKPVQPLASLDSTVNRFNSSNTATWDAYEDRDNLIAINAAINR